MTTTFDETMHPLYLKGVKTQVSKEGVPAFTIGTVVNVYANNKEQPIAVEVEFTDFEITQGYKLEDVELMNL
jgi:hypothetical protein